MNLIIGEEFTSNYEEKDNSGCHIRNIVAQAESLGNLAASFLQEHDKEAGENHAEWIELSQP